MSKTKKRILETAKTLFNDRGLSKVTLRTIANELGMSQGNLNYHFRKREDIIAMLYFEMVEMIDEKLAEFDGEKAGLNTLFSTSQVITTCFCEYKFFLLDFVQILRESAKIKEHYIELTKRRRDEFAELFSSLVKNGVLRKEELPDEYANLYCRFEILGNFWIPSSEIIDGTLTPEIVNRYSMILGQSMYPYLTEKGKEEFMLLITKSED